MGDDMATVLSASAKKIDLAGIPISRLNNGLIEINYKGQSHEEILKDLDQMSYVSDFARTIIRNSPTLSIGKYKMGLISGDDFDDKERTIENVSSRAGRLRYVGVHNPILGALLGTFLTDKLLREYHTMQAFVMHEPKENPEGEDCYLGIGSRFMPQRFAAYAMPKPIPTGCAFVYEIPMRYPYPDMDDEEISRQKAA
jgi:hypothetical protein